MTTREVWLSDLVGRTVRDRDGRSLGRIEELRADVELHASGKEYVVTEFHVGTYGALEGLAGSRFAQHVVRRLPRLVGYERYVIRWDQLDLTDPAHPRATVPRASLARPRDRDLTD